MTVKSCEKKPVYRTLDSGAKTALLQVGWARIWCSYTLPSELFVFMTVTPKRVRPLGGADFGPTASQSAQLGVLLMSNLVADWRQRDTSWVCCLEPPDVTNGLPIRCTLVGDICMALNT